MSSSNLVEVTVIEETTYGETPVAGDFETARFTSEALSGTPETTESQQIRTDRLSSGQIVTGLTVGGDISFEVAKETALDLFFKSAMQNEWVASAPITEDLTIDATAKTITRSAGDFTAQVRVGDTIILDGFVAAANNVEVTVARIDSALIITYVGPTTGLVDEAGSGTTFQVADYLEIGITKKSLSVQKRFLDLTQKAIIYKGMVASDLDLNVAWGEIVTGSVSLSGSEYDPVDASGDFITDGRTVNPAGTTQSLNGSVDMPYVGVEGVGILDGVTFCIQSVGITLGNNLTAQNCIGKAAANDFSLGTGQVGVTLSSYLADQNWDFLGKKLTQEPFAMAFQIKNADGWYSFFMPAVQVSFDDPASAGQNQDVIMSMEGQAKVGALGESSLRIYRSA